MSVLVLLTAWFIDQCFGEPKRYHPLVGFGRYAQWLERRTNSQRDNTGSVLMGLAAMLVGILPFAVIACYLELNLAKHSVLLALTFDIIVVYWAIGLKSLQQHALSVYAALRKKEVALARRALSMIVSRDTYAMNQQAIASATVETTLENGCDAFFGVIFWYLIGGAPAVIAYRLCNTLDAMWGYRTSRFEYFGKASAKLDDVLNYIPARLTALSYALAGNFKHACLSWCRYSKALVSPNAGPVMSAGAGSLGVRLGGPTRYRGKLTPKPYFGGTRGTTYNDIKRSIQLLHYATVIWFCSMMLATLFYYCSS